jgi:hypothetical protein
MKKLSLATVAVCALGIALAATLAWANDEVEANVPFAFIVDGNKTLPAGEYAIRAEGPDEAPVTIRNVKTGKEYILRVVTRLAQFDMVEPAFVFDKTADGAYFLSEVHIPGIDGFSFQGAPGKHTHVKVTPKKS